MTQQHERLAGIELVSGTSPSLTRALCVSSSTLADGISTCGSSTRAGPGAASECPAIGLLVGKPTEPRDDARAPQAPA